ncbi:hypothetical protein BJ123_1454 [Rhodopseudomonas thermotolerans]|uniref:Uncharacterized protein n=2 Tax=Rhodopseudomonas TaxID=1073 RepID=A0A336JVJ6_9BRAD|nr:MULTISPECIES: hypothetical protein [Rhodopseudomonas]RED21691.1 hypothetical protein BJ125_1454 [Rhodopseudomonas pentothenatexigens]REF88204.1 hypothetical protein BJ123_1454 [Rhodopseudomonas thermotolerans]SSW93620.1 hypothetical protein SAMN05892882_1454 [Rhodopseudomonas pentothenatexigens]
MRQTDSRLSKLETSTAALLRTARLAAVAVGIGLVLTAGVARAEDEGDDSTFEEKIIKGLMSGIGATNMDNSGIEYRERSPLVVPPKLDLPPPETASAAAPAPNWPKDADLQRRKEIRAAEAKSKPSPWESAQPLTPSQLKSVRADSGKGGNDPMQPGNQQNNPMLSPSQLGFNGSLWNVFSGNKTETATFTGEPPRESLTEPPAGYQTPSPNFAYGTGPKEALGNKRVDIMSGKETSY